MFQTVNLAFPPQAGCDKKPRGWAFPHNGKLLKVGVPNLVSFEEFVEEVKGTDVYTG